MLSASNEGSPDVAAYIARTTIRRISSVASGAGDAINTSIGLPATIKVYRPGASISATRTTLANDGVRGGTTTLSISVAL